MSITELVKIARKLPSKIRPMLKRTVEKMRVIDIAIQKSEFAEKTVAAAGTVRGIASDIWNSDITVNTVKVERINSAIQALPKLTPETAKRVIDCFRTEISAPKNKKANKYRLARPVELLVTNIEEIVGGSLSDVYDPSEQIHLATAPTVRFKSRNALLVTTRKNIFVSTYHVVLSGATYVVYPEGNEVSYKGTHVIGHVNGREIFTTHIKKNAIRVFLDESILIKCVSRGKKESEPNITTMRASEFL